MQFTPFSFYGQSVPTINNPNEIDDLTFWLDFNNTGSMVLNGSNIVAITSSFVSSSNNIEQYITGSSGTSAFKLTGSLSNPSKQCALVVAQPTQYGLIGASGAGNPSIVQGPKTYTNEYPDGMTFMVLNRTFSDFQGYYLTRFNGAVDYGTFYALSGGSPPALNLYAGDYATSGLSLNATSTPNIIMTRENSGTSRKAWNGSTLTASDTANVTQSGNARQFYNIGRFSMFGTTESIPLGTYYCEIIHYNRVLTSTERTKVWNYLSKKWNITL